MGLRRKEVRIIAVAAGLCCLLAGCSDSAVSGSAVSAASVSGWEPIPAGESAPAGQTGAIQRQETESTETAAEESGTGESAADAAATQAEAAAAVTSEEEATAETASAEEVSVLTAAAADLSGAIQADDATLMELMQNFMTEYGLNASNFAIAFRDLTTGSTLYFNELKQWDACSTYKLPLNLLYYDMQAAGDITGDTIIPGTDTSLAECHHQSLEYSNNPLSEAMMDNLGSYDQVKRRMRKYFTLTDAETDQSYYHHNYFCARQMMDCAQYLYTHQNDYQEALGYLEAAQPGQYFKRYISGVTIAQKYGLRDGYSHNAGIVFGDHPFVLSVYSYQAGGDEMIAQCAKRIYDYLAADRQVDS